MGDTRSTLADLTRVEGLLARLLELVGDPAANGGELREAWRLCTRAFGELPAPEELGRLARGDAELATRLRSVVRLNGLVREGAQRQGAQTGATLERLRTQRDRLAAWRDGSAGASCDMTG